MTRGGRSAAPEGRHQRPPPRGSVSGVPLGGTPVTQPKCEDPPPSPGRVKYSQPAGPAGPTTRSRRSGGTPRLRYSLFRRSDPRGVTLLR